MMRYQRVSPDVLPLPNGRKPNNHPRTCKEDDATYPSSLEAKPLRVRSGSGSVNNPNQTQTQTHQDSSSSNHHHNFPHFPPTSDQVPPEPQQAPSSSNSNGRDVLLQWGHKKRSRGSRTENRTAGDDSSSQSTRQMIKIQRRAAIAGAEKIAAAAAAAAMPPPCGSGYTRGANLRPCMPLRDSSGASHSRMVEERSGGQNHRSEKRSPPSPPEKPHSNKPTVTHNGFGPTDTVSMNHHSDPKAGTDHQHETTTTTSIPAEKVSLDYLEWPRIFVSLSRKEKEDDFLAMKGTKLPQRPKKRAKNIDKALQYCYPGLWLSDLPRGRYEVREKKCVKKKPRGLKGMENMESDSE